MQRGGLGRRRRVASRTWSSSEHREPRGHHHSDHRSPNSHGWPRSAVAASSFHTPMRRARYRHRCRVAPPWAPGGYPRRTSDPRPIPPRKRGSDLVVDEKYLTEFLKRSPADRTNAQTRSVSGSTSSAPGEKHVIRHAERFTTWRLVDDRDPGHDTIIDPIDCPSDP